MANSEDNDKNVKQGQKESKVENTVNTDKTAKKNMSNKTKKKKQDAKISEETNIKVCTYASKYYTDQTKLIWVLNVLLLVFIVGLAGFIFLEFISRPKPYVFQANANNQIITPSSVDVQGMSDNAMLNWASRVIINGFAMNYTNIVKRIKEMKPNFTEQGFESYQKSLRDDIDITKVYDERLVLKANLTKQNNISPKIIKEGKISGRYAWQVEIPITLISYAFGATTTMNYKIELFIVRVPNTESPKGLAIINYKAVKLGRT